MSSEDRFKDMRDAVEFFKDNPPRADFPVPVPVEIAVEDDGSMRYVTPEEFAERDDEELLESGMSAGHIAALRHAVLAEKDPVKVGFDESQQIRFQTIASKEYALENREQVEKEIREFLQGALVAGTPTEVVDEMVETMFTTRTLEEPPVIPTNIPLFGRDADTIAPGETGETHDAYLDHMESHWGF